MAEPGEQLNPTPDNPKPLADWSNQEIEKFVDAFSLDDFELVTPKEGEEEGFVKVRIPDTVEPMAKALLASQWKIVEAFNAPLERQSQEVISDNIGRTANIVNASEAQEAGWIQSFGEFTEVAAMMAGKPDPALEKMKSGIRRESHNMVASSFKILLGIAVQFSWGRFIQKQIDEYGQTEPPQNVIDEFSAKHSSYQEMKSLIDRDPYADQTPRFVVVNSTGRQIFKSTPEINPS